MFSLLSISLLIKLSNRVDNLISLVIPNFRIPLNIVPWVLYSSVIPQQYFNSDNLSQPVESIADITSKELEMHKKSIKSKLLNNIDYETYTILSRFTRG